MTDVPWPILEDSGLLKRGQEQSQALHGDIPRLFNLPPLSVTLTTATALPLRLTTRHCSRGGKEGVFRSRRSSCPPPRPRTGSSVSSLSPGPGSLNPPCPCPASRLHFCIAPSPRCAPARPRRGMKKKRGAVGKTP